jgi:heterogeneous nuclear ribonucleoprotein U-like protein 1
LPGEDGLSWGYGGTAKSAGCGEFKDYGVSFGLDNVVGVYLDMETDAKITMSFTVDGVDQGVAFTVEPADIDGKALFPHILSKNSKFEVNFGERAEGPYFPNPDRLADFVACSQVALEDRVRGPVPAATKEECEVCFIQFVKEQIIRY